MASTSKDAEQTDKGSTPVQRRPRKRSSIGGPRNVLKLTGTEPGYQYRVVNDLGDRVDSLKELGYEIVDDPNVRVGDARAGKARQVGTAVEASVGQGMKAVVMRIREEWYNEDQAEKQAQVRADEDSMYQRAKREESDYGSLKVTDRE